MIGAAKVMSSSVSTVDKGVGVIKVAHDTSRATSKGMKDAAGTFGFNAACVLAAAAVVVAVIAKR